MAGLYIHIPFCKQKCHYCDFYFSVSLRNKDDLIEAIKKELVLRKKEVNEPIETIYFGGGTPSLLSYDELAGIFVTIESNYTINDNVEITLESNPDDLSKSFLKDLKKLPINRLSIGVQSFFDDDLQFMNRAHSSKEALKSIKLSKEIGFENITIDLIYGIPNLSQEKWQKNLDIFLSLNIPHLSAYALTIEPKTVLAYFIKTKKIIPLDEALAKNHFDILMGFMKENNYLHYELSNFAKETFLSKHNTSYWQGKAYLGIGPSAHSYNIQTRSWNMANTTRYIKSLNANILPNEVENLDISTRYNEYIMTSLRTMWGIDFDILKNDFGEPYYKYFLKKSLPYIKKNNLQIINNKVIVVSDYFFLIDGIIVDLFWVS